MDRWVMMGLIGFSVGVIGFLLHQLIEKVADIKWEMTEDFIQVSLYVYKLTNAALETKDKSNAHMH